MTELGACLAEQNNNQSKSQIFLRSSFDMLDCLHFCRWYSWWWHRSHGFTAVSHSRESVWSGQPLHRIQRWDQVPPGKSCMW